MPIALIFDKTRPDTIGIYFERACRALGVAYEHWWLRDAQQIPATYDLYLRIDHGDDYLTDLPTRLRPSVFYAIDTHLPKSWRKIRRTASRYDAMFCSHRSGASRLPGAEWLPVACDWEWHGDRGLARSVDVAFVGMDGGIPRKFYLQALRERYPNSVIGPADHTELGRIYSSARIGFNYSIADEVNMRMFEVLSAGTLLVTNRLSHDAFGALGFQEGVHFVAYQGPRDLFDVIDACLSQDARRERIAQQGMAFVRERHTYSHRLLQFLQLVGERLGVRVMAHPQREPLCVS